MALLVLATPVGGANGERVLYLLFLVAGLGVGRVQRGPARPTVRAGNTIEAC